MPEVYPTSKSCTKCKVTKTFDNFSRCISRADGLQCWCRDCLKEYSETRRVRKPIPEPKWWHCLKHEERESARKSQWQKDNREKHRASGAKYRVNNLEKVRKSARERARLAYAVDPTKRLRNTRAYAARNPDRIRARAALRKANELNATPSWVSYKEIGKFYRIAAKLWRSTGISHNVDHIVPLKGKNVCGLHVPWNLQVLTAVENRRKSNHLCAA